MKATEYCGPRWVRAAAVLAMAGGCTPQVDPFEDPPTACKAAPAPAIAGREVSDLPSLETFTAGKVAPASAQGQPMAQAGPLLLVADEDNGTVVALDTSTLQVAATWPVGARPYHVVATDTDAWVSLRGGSSVAHITLESGAITYFAVGTEPTGLALGSSLFVAVAGTRDLLALDPQTGEILAKAKCLDRPRAVAIDNAGRVTVVHQNAGVMAFSMQQKGNLSSRGQCNLSPFTSLLGDIPPEQMGVRHATRAVAAAVDPATNLPVVAYALVRSGTMGDLLKVANAPAKPDCNAGGSGSDSGMLGGGSGGYGGGSEASEGAILASGGVRPVEPALAEVNSDWGGTSVSMLAWRAAVASDSEQVAYQGRRVAARIDQPSALAFHPTYRMALLVGRGTHNVVAMDSSRHGPIGLIELPPASAPGAVVIAADGDTAWVKLDHAFRVAEVDLQPLLNNANHTLTVLQAKRVSAPYGVDPLPEAARLGRAVFFDSENPRLSQAGQFACATCHLDGEDDQQVWFVADGPRQTPALGGRLAGTGPFNWKGTHMQLQSNMEETVKRMHGTGLTKAELVSLEQFLLVGLPTPPNPNRQPGGLTEAQTRGKAIFEGPKAACAVCHTAGGGSDGELHDVGVATVEEVLFSAVKAENVAPTGFNTPSLAGVYRSAPYFHNGSALTLREVLSQTSDLGAMGDTSDLSDQDRDDLIAYLLTL
ncbi:MAG: c-type cytochrome [Deltaproteobacteria bacterium]|nr:c-type cytochrome [Deltaproteobacteria bacterium]